MSPQQDGQTAILVDGDVNFGRLEPRVVFKAGREVYLASQDAHELP